MPSSEGFRCLMMSPNDCNFSCLSSHLSNHHSSAVTVAKARDTSAAEARKGGKEGRKWLYNKVTGGGDNVRG